MGRFNHLETTARKDELPGPAAGIEASAPAVSDDSGSTLPDQDAAGCLRTGDESFFRGDARTAMRWYSRAIDKDGRCIGAWVALARMLLLKGDLQDAQTWIGRGLTVFPNGPQLLALRAVNYARRGMLRQAMTNSDAVLEQNPTEPLAHIARGEVLLLADNKHADFCFEQAVKQTQPADWKTPMLIGLICEERRQWAKALGFYTKAAERNERHPALWYHVGLCRAELGQAHLAQKAYTQAEALCPPGDPLLPRLEKAKSGSFIQRLINVFRRK